MNECRLVAEGDSHPRSGEDLWRGAASSRPVKASLPPTAVLGVPCCTEHGLPASQLTSGRFCDTFMWGTFPGRTRTCLRSGSSLPSQVNEPLVALTSSAQATGGFALGSSVSGMGASGPLGRWTRNLTSTPEGCGTLGRSALVSLAGRQGVRSCGESWS